MHQSTEIGKGCTPGSTTAAREMSGLTHYPVATALSIHQHIRHPGAGHVRTAGNEGRKTFRVAHVVGILDRTIFSPALIAVAGAQLSLFTSQPCVFFGGGGGSVLDRVLPKLARRVHTYCTR